MRASLEPCCVRNIVPRGLPSHGPASKPCRASRLALVFPGMPRRSSWTQQQTCGRTREVGFRRWKIRAALRRRARMGCCLLVVAAVVVHACASDSQQDSGPLDGFPIRDAAADAEPDRYAADATLPDAGRDGAPSGAVQLCGGEASLCNPEDVEACGDVEHGGAGAGGIQLACQVRVVEGEQVAECQPAGSGQASDPCVSPADCAPGYTCVGESGTSQCRKYCCSSAAVCPEQTFCAQRSLRDLNGVQSAPRVPVCIPPTPCSLDEPFPCDPAAEEPCSCQAGTACMVVRDGLTSCATPGTGKAGESCPCAAGHVCSQATSTCLELCRFGNLTDEACGDGECQSSSSIPSSHGVCVGRS